MSDPILELGDKLHWDLVRRQKYVAQTVTVGDDIRYLPIPDISFALSSYVLMLGTKSSKAKVHWKLGCWVNMKLLISPSSQSDYVAAVQVYRQFCSLGGLTLLQLPHYQPLPYLLVLSVPRWHQEIEIELWQYSGPDSNTDTESLKRIELKLDQGQGQGDRTLNIEIADQ